MGKPEAGEGFQRSGLSRGQGALREEATYLIDRLCGSTAGVPVTSRACIDIDGENVRGSVQAFASGAIGCIEDFAMPRDLEQARQFVAQETAEALALLDMRVFNMDRHTGNLLLLDREAPHGLGPIDHGCCFPPWWSLGEAVFDAWFDWPQIQCQPSAEARKLCSLAYAQLPSTCEKLQSLGLEMVSIVTVQLCTLFLKVGIGDLGIPLKLLASLMQRDFDDFDELTWLQKQVQICAGAVGTTCCIVQAARG